MLRFPYHPSLRTWFATSELAAHIETFVESFGAGWLLVPHCCGSRSQREDPPPSTYGLAAPFPGNAVILM